MLNYFIKNKYLTKVSILISFYLVGFQCEHPADSLEMINHNLLSGIYQGNTDIYNVLQNYFETRSVPDSVSAIVDSLALADKDDYIMDKNRWKSFAKIEVNPYEVESDLKNLVRLAMRAHINADSVIYRKYIHRAMGIAFRLSESFSNKYWENWLQEVSTYTPGQAQAWLRAETAHNLCRKYHDKLDSGPLAECYGAYALKCLKIAPDKRLELDVNQRLQVFLFYYYPYHRLSVSWADVNFQRAEKIGYHLRATGFLYHKAESLHFIGENDQAIHTFLQIIESTRLHQNIPYISWFDLHSQIYLASCYIDNDQIIEAQQVCQKLEKYDLNDIQKTQLHILYGLSYRITGEYEQSEQHYQLAQQIIEANEDYYNLIVIYNNLGFLYYQLTEYRKSLQFLQKGITVIDHYQPHNIEYKSRILLAEAGAYRALGRTDSAEIKLDQANQATIALGFFPNLQAELLTRSGEIYFDLENYPRALQLFRKGDSLCLAYGLVKQHLDLIAMKLSTLLKLGKYDEAVIESDRLLEKAQTTDNREKMIEAFAGLAEAAYRSKNITLAVDLSEKMLVEVEALSAGYKRTLRLTSLRQKLYDFLKRSVKYEIENNHLSEAFIKLGYAKARALQVVSHQPAFDLADRENFLNPDKITALRARIKPNSLVLDYFISEDILYVFTVDQRSLRLFKKQISIANLKSDVLNYLEAINGTITVYNNYDSVRISRFYRRIVSQGHQLYESLLGFSGLDTLLTNCTQLYIIKDEFLHQLPFATLVFNQAENSNFLIQKAAVTNIPSNQFLYMPQPGLHESRNQEAILLSADTSFPGVDRLVNRILKQYPDHVLLSDTEKMDKIKVLAHLKGSFGKLIFIGHGLSNPDFPELSELIIRPENNRNQNPPIVITLGDLFKIGYLNIDLGILLGCETGRGKLYRGSGMMGFHQGLLSLGIKRVIGTFWNIEAAQSINCAENLFSIAADWSEPAACLRQAQLDMIHELTEDPYFRYPNPYFWGSFSYNTIEL